MTPPKLVLCVIDAMAPAMLERAVAEGAAPVLGELMRRGRYVPDCAAAFPSVTPVCAASIATGAGQERHLIPAMNWYHREEARYVEYGSSFRASQRFGIARQLTDTVYNMNRAHLAPEPLTVFEALDDAGVRTAGTTYLIYRGRHRHEPQRDSALTRIASATLLRHAVMGPRELFYADIFASRRTGCRSGLGMPGVRDQHSGCVAAYMVEHDLFDFLLLSLPDNDWHSHKHGPEGQVRSLALADRQLARMIEPAGGLERFLESHAMVVMADHSQAPVRATVALQDALAELGVLEPGRGSRSRLHRLLPEARPPRVARPLPGGGDVANGRPPLRASGHACLPRARAGSDRGLPHPARGDGLRARRTPPRGAALGRGAPRAAAGRRGARDVAGARRPRRAGRGGDRAALGGRAALLPRRRGRGRARGSLERGGRARRARRERARRRAVRARAPRRARPRVVRADLPHLRGGAALRRARV